MVTDKFHWEYIKSHKHGGEGYFVAASNVSDDNGRQHKLQLGLFKNWKSFHHNYYTFSALLKINIYLCTRKTASILLLSAKSTQLKDPDNEDIKELN